MSLSSNYLKIGVLNVKRCKKKMMVNQGKFLINCVLSTFVLGYYCKMSGNDCSSIPLFTAEFPFALLRATSHTSKLLGRSGLLNSGTQILPMSPASMQELMLKFAEKPNKSIHFIPKHRLDVIGRTFLAVLLAKLLGKQSWQIHPVRIQLHILRHLMTKRIPRQRPGILQQQIPRISCEYMRKLFASSPPKSVLLDNLGFSWKTESRSSLYSQFIKHMTKHPNPKQPFIAMVDMWGQVWIGRTDCPDQKLFLIYDGYLKRDDSATTCTFHSYKRILAIGKTGEVLIYDFSDSLDSMVCRQRVDFSLRSEKLSVSEIKSHSHKTIFTVVSHFSSNVLTMAFLLNSKFVVTSEAQISARLPLSAGNNPIFCACFLPDGPNGESVATGHRDGKVSLWTLKHVGNRIDMLYKQTMKFLDDGYRIEKIDVCPINPTILALYAERQGVNYVYVVRTSPDGSSTQIIGRFLCAHRFQFFDKFLLLIQIGGSIELHLLRDDYKLVKVLEFTPRSGQIESCVLTTLNGEGIIRYSLRGSAAQYTLQLNGFSEYNLYF